jgi:hypothetical protein
MGSSTFEKTHHDTKAQAQGGSEECVVLLYPEILLAGEPADDYVNVDDAGA